MSSSRNNRDLTDLIRRMERGNLSSRSGPSSSSSAVENINASEIISKSLTEENLPTNESSYYKDCKEYFQLTGIPLLSVSSEISKSQDSSEVTVMKFGLDFEFNGFNPQAFLDKICQLLKLECAEIEYSKIWKKEMVIEMELFKNLRMSDKKAKLFATYKRFTSQIAQDLATMKVFFGYLGSQATFKRNIKYRNEITLNPTYNRFYWPGTPYFWTGANVDGKNRGNHNYYCPVGWKRYSFFVTENFDEKFSGWSICYHGTKFHSGLSILLSGFTPADIAIHEQDGVYFTPSINYAAHPRYAEIQKIKSGAKMDMFRPGEFVQIVLECRVRLDSDYEPKAESLLTGKCIIDPNIPNDQMEWLIASEGKSLLDFNDPNPVVVCTGVMIRRTDRNPALLPESDWWFQAKIRYDKTLKDINEMLTILEGEKQKGVTSAIIPL